MQSPDDYNFGPNRTTAFHYVPGGFKMIGDIAHICLVRCVDLDENVYDLTKVVSERVAKADDGRDLVSGVIEFYYKEQLVDWKEDGSFDIFENGESLNVREISPD